MAHARRLVVSILVVMLIAAAAQVVTAQDAKPAGLKVSGSLAKRLVKNFLSGNEKRAAAARQMLLRTRPEDRKTVFAALEAWKVKPPKRKNKKERVIHGTLSLTEGGHRGGEFLIHLPRKYNGKKPYPLVYRLHGSGDQADGYARNWASNSLADRFIAATPTIPSADRMGWNQPGAAELLDKIYLYMLRNFNVDTDRVYLAGYSAGGGACFMYAQTWPERIAAIFSRSRLHPKCHLDWDGSMSVMQWIPGFYQVGLNDTEDRISGYRRAEAYFKKHGYTAEFNFVEGRGHEYMPEFDKTGYGYLLKHRRKNYPKTFRAMYFDFSNWTDQQRARNAEQHWLRAKKFDLRSTPVEVSANGNVIEVKGRVFAGSVLLNDRLVDLDQTVTIKVNGKEVWSGKVERSVDFLLRWYERTPDPRRLFWNEVPFTTKGAPAPPSGLGKIKPGSDLGKIKPPGE